MASFGVRLALLAGLMRHFGSHAVLQAGVSVRAGSRVAETRDATALVQQAGSLRGHRQLDGQGTKACVPVTNGDFEAGTLGAIPTGWQQYSVYGSTGKLTTDAQHSGAQSVYFEGSDWQLIEKGPAAEDVWSLSSGSTYTLTFWAKTESGDVGFKIRTELIPYDSYVSGAGWLGRLLGGTVAKVYDVVPGEWTQFSYTFTPTETWNNVRLNIGKTNDSPATGKVYLDSIHLNCGEELWPQEGPSYTKCTTTENTVSSQHECQEQAIAAGHGYYQYNQDNGRCESVSTCDSLIIGTSWEWKIYKMELWADMGWDHTVCVNAFLVVADQYACQASAITAGHSYYQYTATSTDGTARCYTASICDEPMSGKSLPWRVYYQFATMSPTMSPTTASPTESPTGSPTTKSPTASPTMSPTTASPTASPTGSPTTKSPTTSPTMSPTTGSPTASPTASMLPAATTANLIGDPHITSMHGKRFDVHLTGNVTLLRIPKSTETEPLLKLTGLLHNVDPKCRAGTYLTALHVDGAWLPRRREFYTQPRRGAHRRHQRLTVGPHNISIVVVHGKTETGVPYLNIRVNNLGRLGLSVGGLLGSDAPEEKPGMPADCA